MNPLFCHVTHFSNGYLDSDCVTLTNGGISLNVSVNLFCPSSIQPLNSFILSFLKTCILSFLMCYVAGFMFWIVIQILLVGRVRQGNLEMLRFLLTKFHLLLQLINQSRIWISCFWRLLNWEEVFIAIRLEMSLIGFNALKRIVPYFCFLLHDFFFNSYTCRFSWRK